MKTFKRIDCWISAVLVILFAILSLIRMDATFIYGYFIVGAWQIISMLVHEYNRSFCGKGSARTMYHRIVIIVLSCALTGFLIYPLLFIVLAGLLFAAPLMAVYYTWLCYNEVYVKMQRPLAVLK